MEELLTSLALLLLQDLLSPMLRLDLLSQSLLLIANYSFLNLAGFLEDGVEVLVHDKSWV